jgi:hypothetical protein
MMIGTDGSIQLQIRMAWKGGLWCLIVDYSNRSWVSHQPTIFKMHHNLFTDGRCIDLNDVTKGSADLNDIKALAIRSLPPRIVTFQGLIKFTVMLGHGRAN